MLGPVLCDYDFGGKAPLVGDLVVIKWFGNGVQLSP